MLGLYWSWEKYTLKKVGMLRLPTSVHIITVHANKPLCLACGHWLLIRHFDLGADTDILSENFWKFSFLKS